jgi:hypothetical protein
LIFDNFGFDIKQEWHLCHFMPLIGVRKHKDQQAGGIYPGGKQDEHVWHKTLFNLSLDYLFCFLSVTRPSLNRRLGQT